MFLGIMPDYELDELNLFKPGYSLNDVKRKSIRPLGEISDFVIEEMPKRLAEIRSDGAEEGIKAFTGSVENILSNNEKNLWPFFENFGMENKGIAALDL